MIALGIVAFAIIGLIIVDNIWDDPAGLYSAIVLIIGFGIGSIYLFGEYFNTHGIYTSEWIMFHSPWTGTKLEKWTDLKTINYESSYSWFVLTFEDEKKIRLSAYLGGLDGLPVILHRLGHDVARR